MARRGDTPPGERAPRALSGLSDKLYWRASPVGLFHCFKKQHGGGFRSLCGDWTLERSGGGAMHRPPVYQRCARCDGEEIKRRGWEESGPAEGERR